MRSAKTGKRIQFVPRENPAIVPYRKAAHELMQNRTWKICHGVIWAFNELGERVEKGHAWLEKQGMAWDPHFETLMTVKAYYRLHKVDTALVAVYTYAEAWEQMKTVRSYRNWEVSL